MDTNIANELKKLQEKRQAVNIETDLSGHCDALIGLDLKVGMLLDDIRNLHVDVEERFGFVKDVWDQLKQPYKTLEKVDGALDLMIELQKLTRICRRIDTSPYIGQTKEDQFNLTKPSLTTDGEDDENFDENDDKIIVQMVQELLDRFEVTYKPLEGILSKRLDLPYIAYATKVRNFQTTLTEKLEQWRSKSRKEI